MVEKQVAQRVRRIGAVVVVATIWPRERSGVGGSADLRSDRLARIGQGGRASEPGRGRSGGGADLMGSFDRQPLAVREQLALVFGEIGDRRVVDLLWRCVRTNERWLRLHAVQALAALQHVESLPKLLELLANESDLWLRATLLTAVARLGGAELEPILSAHLTHQDARVRANAVEALGLLKSPGALELIRPTFRDPNDRVRVNAALALWKLGDVTVLATLRGMCVEHNKWIKSSAAFALGEIGAPEATPDLLALLRDREEVVYRNALEALVKIGDLRALVPLLKEKSRGRLPEATIENLLPQFAHRLRHRLAAGQS